MRYGRPIRLFAAVALCGGLISVAQAQDTGFYVGGSVGQGFVDEGVYDDDDTAFTGFVGYDVNQYFGLEAGYVDLGSYRPEGPAADILPDLDATSAYGALVGKIPFSRGFTGFGKVGAQRWDTDEVVPGLTAGDDSGTDVMFGLGVDWAMAPQWSLRGEWQRFAVEDADVDVFTLGVAYHF